MEVEPLLAVGPSSAKALPDSDPVLVEQLKAEIARSGPITFARFMAVALTDPDRGYYATTDDRPTRSGDFLTAPELHPVFGATLARALEALWRAIGAPDPFDLVEFGAGSGQLALDILHGLRDRSADLLEALRYRPIEVVPRRGAAINERLAAAGFERQLAPPASVQPGPPASVQPDPEPVQPDPTPEARVGIALANEFLDALPVHRVEQTPDGLVELNVDWSDAAAGFIEVGGPPSSPNLAARLAEEGIVLEPGQRAEICLELDRWADELTTSVDRGLALVIDYGDAAASLYGGARPRGTLLAYAGHRVHEDVFAAIGRQDVTAHVDFSAVTAAAERRGWHRSGMTTQASFLVAAGLQGELQTRRSDPMATAQDYLALRSAVGRLLDPRVLGGFRVLGLERGVASSGGESPVATWWAAVAPVG